MSFDDNDVFAGREEVPPPLGAILVFIVIICGLLWLWS
jgi:hypothetical protein